MTRVALAALLAVAVLPPSQAFALPKSKLPKPSGIAGEPGSGVPLGKKRKSRDPGKLKAPAPMLIAVGMYLPFYATAGIFVGGIFRWMLDTSLEKRNADDAQKQKAENTGVLVSSGLIAGGALTAVVIAFIVLGYNMMAGDDALTFLDRIRGAIGVTPKWWLGLIAFAGGIWLLVRVPLKASTER